MVKPIKESSAERVAKINGRFSVRTQIVAGVFVILSACLTWLLIGNSKGPDSPAVLQTQTQKLDSGQLNNYNAGRDIKIENSFYPKGFNLSDSIPNLNGERKKVPQPILKEKKDIEVNVSSTNQSGGQTAYEINNNK
ncbi:MAG: hypothetical protein ABWZ25_04040 [Chitinophagaceae bacterium]